MTAVAEVTDQYVAAFRELESSGPSGPTWLQRLRREALDRFAERGFPTRKDEEWKYTDIASVARRGFALLRPQNVTGPVSFPTALESLEGVRLVFVNGAWDRRL